MLTKIIIFAIISLTGFAEVRGQYSRLVVEFTDKKNTPFQLSDPSTYLSARAIHRRAAQGIGIDSTDLPIVPAYLDSLRALAGLTILNQSRWMNQVLVKLSDPSIQTQIAEFSFVRSVKPVALRARQLPMDSLSVRIDQAAQEKGSERVVAMTAENGSATALGPTGNLLDYGNAYAQIHIHEGEYLHNQGFRGNGIIIALLDAGFEGYLTNPVFDSLRQSGRVLGTYDYVNEKTSVNEENSHGAYCLSVIAANAPGKLTGSGLGASFWLLKTEDPLSEYPVEEQNWVAAAEFADSAGADLISTSLGYINFDNPTFNHPYAQRDGHSTLISQAANRAVSKGMIVVASAGNEGNHTDDSHFVGCPADADSVLAVGAINAQGTLAPFSSRGPNASGQTKPGVVSVGLGTALASPSGDLLFGDGTSFSAPNIAGLVACLWQAFPEFNNHDIMQAVLISSDRAASPDEQFGYGIPNFRKAFQYLLGQKIFLNYISNPANPDFNLFPVPYTSQFTVVFKPAQSGQATLRLIDVNGKILETLTVNVSAGVFSSARFSRAPGLAKGVYFIRYDDGHEQKTLRTIRL